MILVGILLSTVGTDLETGEERMTFGLQRALRRRRFRGARHGHVRLRRDPAQPRADRDPRRRAGQPSAGCCPTWQDLQQSAGADRCAARRSASILGILPGNGAVLGPFASYTLEKKLAKDPSPLRPRRHRGRRRAGIGQQRRRADLLHPAAHARHPAERRDGADGRRHDHPRHRAGPAGHDQATRTCSGA